MSERVEGAALKLARGILGRVEDVSEHYFVALASGEWAISFVIDGGNDRRFRYTRGNLHDEANIGDARVA